MFNERNSGGATFLLGGALLGAAAMYLLDPEVGNRRRHRLAAAAEGAGHTVSDSLGHLSGRARALAGQAVDRAAHLRDEAAGSSHGWADQARNIASQVKEHAADWGQWANQGAAKAASEGRSWVNAHDPREHQRSATPAVIGAAVAVTAAGFMGYSYFWNPVMGRDRRQWVMDQLHGCLESTGRVMRATGSDIASRLWGVAEQTRDKAHEFVDRVEGAEPQKHEERQPAEPTNAAM